MVVHFYEIPGCTCANAEGRPVLIAPDGTPPSLLTKYDFVLLDNGQWGHFLTTPEYEHVMTGYPDHDVVFGGSAPMSPSAPAPSAPTNPEDGNNLATVGLLLLAGSFFVPMIVGGGVGALMNVSTDTESPGHAILYGILQILSVLSSIAGAASFVIMIVTRVKYPQNTRGKVLMWIFIVLAILAALATIALIVACVSCLDSLRNCPG